MHVTAYVAITVCLRGWPLLQYCAKWWSLEHFLHVFFFFFICWAYLSTTLMWPLASTIPALAFGGRLFKTSGLAYQIQTLVVVVCDGILDVLLWILCSLLWHWRPLFCYQLLGWVVAVPREWLLCCLLPAFGPWSVNWTTSGRDCLSRNDAVWLNDICGWSGSESLCRC